MPVVTRVCECGEQWDDLVGVVDGPDSIYCKACGRASERTLPGSFAPVFCGTEHMSEGDVRAGLENKAMIEAEADRLRSGEIRVNQKSSVPLALRPEIGRTIY